MHWGALGLCLAYHYTRLLKVSGRTRDFCQEGRRVSETQFCLPIQRGLQKKAVVLLTQNDRARNIGQPVLISIIYFVCR